MSKLKILYLYSELVGYKLPIFEEYVKKYHAEVHVVSWDKNKLKPYSPPEIEGVKFYKRSNFNRFTLLKLANSINPSIIYVSGWMDNVYLYTTFSFVRKGVPVVAGIDDKWKNSVRQNFGRLISKIFFKRLFSHFWVSGPQQYEYAKRMGYSDNEIIFDLLSADTNTFQEPISLKKASGNSFLYVGNFRKVKGTDILVKAYEIYKNQFLGDWNLICVGNGPMKSILENKEGIKLHPFSSPNNLIKLSNESSVFILPSRNDMWGVVVQEFASLGKALILSENVGAKSYFFIDKFNGVSFSNSSPLDLAKKMSYLAKIGTDELLNMQSNSILLSKKMSPVTSAANFISLVKNNLL